MFKKILFIWMLVMPMSQNLIAQFVIGKPTLSFTQACANPSFNEFGVTINFATSTSLDANNQFVVELSDPMGNFTTPTVLYTSEKGSITTTGTQVKVAFPTSTSGEGYKIRVKATTPATTGQNSTVFAAYYKPHDTQFTINNSIPAAAFCSGGSYILKIDPNGNGVNNSPLEFTFLTYNWYRDNSTPTLNVPPTLVAQATSGTYTVTQPGVYYVETNYGTCTSDSYSNRVTITSSSTNGTATITSSQGNPFCPSEGHTTLSTPAGQSYQWYKDNQAIAGATQQTYSAATAGTYSVSVDYGGCQANAAIALQEFQLNASLNIPLSPETTVITPGESVSVAITTDAPNPTYQWFLNDKEISGATAATYSATVKGNYKVVVSQTGSCTVNTELPFIIRYDSDPDPFPDVANIPNLISPNGDFVNDTWILPQEYTNKENVKIQIISAYGEVVLDTTNYQNDWPTPALDVKNINPVYFYIITTADNKVKKGSITVIK
ncbi:T9SS type B sorting domain-containing protein [Flavobacterium agrisoli]|uniref:Gliding motility-associated C-terminal domain-containing protein n=1 Tax=Flavobacterium agrisoli TaxID=2793066 RepID=A0A934UJQ4_9FLAO|nr:gliding motility-associated C-terminal domain-containing protein [Flavobacterium agrisoli]MBK0369660.1 gliding motility-associated C-terminal domain-containing protein [Flavobacterium agrisoli]